MEGIETERKYLIRKPDEKMLEGIEGAEKLEITQTYLLSEVKICSERVRRIVYQDGRVEYTHTMKVRFSDQTRSESEEEISEKEYQEYLLRKDEDLSVVKKVRWKIPMGKLVAEIDLYPFWKKQAYCEVETEEEDEEYTLPDFIEVIREVTGVREYLNRSLAKKIPEEDDV